MGTDAVGSDRLRRTIECLLGGLAAGAAWLAAAPSAIGATQVFRLTDIAEDPRVLAILALLALAAWLGFAGSWRTGHRHR